MAYLDILEGLKKRMVQVQKLLDKDLSLIPLQDQNKHNIAIQEGFEKLCNAARLLPESYAPEPLPEVTEAIREAHGISYHFDREKCIFEARIPALLPKKETGSARWIRATVQSTLREFVGQEAIEPLEGEYVIVYEHLYSEERRRMRDHDNIELNVVMDSIALFLLIDDNAQYLDHFYTGRFAEKDETIVTLVPKHLFGEFIAKKGGWYGTSPKPTVP